MHAFGFSLTDGPPTESTKWHSLSGHDHEGPVIYLRWETQCQSLTIRVRADRSAGIADVTLLSAEPANMTLEKLIGHKTDLWQPCPDVPDTVYHPLAFVYLNGGRLCGHRCENIADIGGYCPEFVSVCEKVGVTIVAYEAAAHPTDSPYKGKLCAVVGCEEFEKMAAVFLGEKVMPLRRDLERE